jgi:hypothetical protein
MSSPGVSEGAPVQRRATPGRGSVITRFVAAELTSLGPREFRGIAATDALCPQDKVALVMSGGDLSRLDKLSWNHSDPVGTITRATATAHELLIEAAFPPLGVDDEIDKLCAKVKGGVPMDLSLQFIVTEDEPIIPGKPDRGMRATKWQALEVALVLVGADPGAKITARKSGRRGVPMSAANHCQTALDEHAAFARHHKEIADATERLDEHRSRLGTALRGLHAAVQAGDQQQAADCHARCMRCMRGIHHEMKAIGDRHQDAQDAYNAVNRALRAAGDVLDLGDQGEPGTTVDDQHGRSGIWSAEFRRREFEDIERRGRMADLAHLQRMAKLY